MRTNHEIDYKIYGEELQFVEIELDPNETAIAESGAFMMMDDGIEALSWGKAARTRSTVAMMFAPLDNTTWTLVSDCDAAIKALNVSVS